MNKNRKIVIFLMVLLLLPNRAWAKNLTYEDEVGVILAGNGNTGQIYYSKNIDEKTSVASMSKLMTYLVVKDEIEKGLYGPEDLVKIGADEQKYNKYEYSNFGLVKGDELTVEELLKGLMVVSGNDAALALAKKSSKSEKEFVKKMNAKAQELGLTKSKFYNSSGLTEEVKDKKYKNEMSATDLFNLSRHILEKYPETRAYGRMDVLRDKKRKYVGYSTLPLRDEMDSIEGLKTGFTDEAQYCFTGLFDMNKIDESQDYDLITVVMGAETPEIRATTTKEVVKYVNANYKMREVLNKDHPFTNVKINSSSKQYIDLYPEEDYSDVLHLYEEVEISYDLEDGKKAPLADKEVMGSIKLKSKGRELKTINLINRGYQSRADNLTRIYRFIGDFINSIATIF